MGRNAVLSGPQKQQSVPAEHIIKVVAAVVDCGFFKWSLQADGLRH